MGLYTNDTRYQLKNEVNCKYSNNPDSVEMAKDLN